LYERKQGSEPIAGFLQDLDRLRADYEDGGGEVSEDDFITLITKRVGTAYSQVAVTHITSPYLDLPTLQGVLLEIEAGLAQSTLLGSASNAEGDGTETADQGQGRKFWKSTRKGGSHVKKGKALGRQKELVCWSCGDSGHPAFMCPERGRPTGKYRPGKK
jgi:hypothetical protein